MRLQCTIVSPCMSRVQSPLLDVKLVSSPTSCGPGPQLEAAWRSRHKWAARRASRVLTDCKTRPPLQPFLSAAQKLSIGLLLLVNSPAGARALAGSEQNSGVGSCWSAPGSDSAWMLNLSYPLGRPLSPPPHPCAQTDSTTSLTLSGAHRLLFPAGHHLKES